MDIKSHILTLLKSQKSGLSKRDIARLLGIKSKDKAALKTALARLHEGGLIERHGHKKWQIAGRLPAVFVAQFYDRDLDGELLARPAHWDKDTPPPQIILVPGEGAGGATGNAIGIGERALIRVTETEDGYEARIIKKLGQDTGAARKMLGVARRTNGGFNIVPTSKKARRPPLVLRNIDATKVEDGDLVVVAPDRGRTHGAQPMRLVERLGDTDAPGAASMIALVEHDVPQGFNDDETEQAQSAKPIVWTKNSPRTDLRDTPLVTIDPDDAKDFDDAIHARADDDPKNPGGWVLLVAIADVSAYVTGGSALDKGARMRGNSVYLADRVVPMLPERLSNDLCSLRPHEERPCMVVQMVIDRQGNKIRHHFMRAIMRSAARLTYTQAQKAIDGQPDETTKPLLEPVLKPLWAAYKALGVARAKRDPLDIDSPERKITLDAQGKITAISKYERFSAHRLVEEFMISANVCAAQTLEQKKHPLIYRVHDAPSREKLFALADFLRSLGIKWSRGERATTTRFNRLIAQTKGGKFKDTINEMVLRTQMQAIYSVRNIGHFGLNLDRYAHFTSPIRRYADLTVHRALIRSCGLGKDGTSDAEQSQLEAIAEEITFNERRALAAERDANDRYVAAFLSQRIGASFKARISGVTRFGLFLRLDETGADGFVPIRQLDGGYFIHEEKSHLLIDSDSGGRYRLGQSVEARLREATPLTGGLLFEMLTPPEPGARPSRHGRQRPHSRGQKHKRRRAHSRKKTS